jgi:hypothetical protein
MRIIRIRVTYYFNTVSEVPSYSVSDFALRAVHPAINKMDKVPVLMDSGRPCKEVNI